VRFQHPLPDRPGFPNMTEFTRVIRKLLEFSDLYEGTFLLIKLVGALEDTGYLRYRYLTCRYISIGRGFSSAGLTKETVEPEISQLTLLIHVEFPTEERAGENFQ